MKFQLLGHELELSEGHKNYLRIVNDFMKISDKAINGFNANLANELFEKYDNGLDYYIKSYLPEVRAYLAKYGVYTLSESEMWNSVIGGESEHTVLDEDFTKQAQDLYSKFEEFAEEDLAMSLYIKEITKLSDNGEFDISIRCDIMAFCDYVLNYLSTNSLVEIEFVSQNDADTAKTIFKNLNNGNIPKIEVKNKAFLLITLDYTESIYYEYIFKSFDEAKYEISQIANYLGIDLSELIEKDLKSSFNLKQISCETDAIEMMKELVDSMAKFGVSDCTRKRELEKILSDFDIKARTYDGFLYETRELREKAKNYDESLSEIHGCLSDKDKTKCLEYMKTISQMECFEAIKDKHLQMIRERISLIDNEYLDNLTKMIESKNEEECNGIKKSIEEYDADNCLKTKYISIVDKRVFDIWDKEDFEKFKEIYIHTNVSDSEQIGINCSKIKELGRTETKELFIKALCLLNENEVESAAKYAVAKESGILASLINMCKKESYEILTLGGRVIHPAIEVAREQVKAKKGNGVLGGLGFLKNKISAQSSMLGINKKNCSSCGEKIDGTSKFCPKCGNKVE